MKKKRKIIEIEASDILRKLKDKKHFDFDDRDKWYFESYRLFTKYFKRKKQLEKEDVLLGFAMAYSWMPTIPEIPPITKKDVNELNRLFNEGTIEETLEFLIPKLNNSLVGSSKFLHFVKPHTYPIWDSKICGLWLGKEKPYHYEVKKIETYEAYKLWCDKIRHQKEFCKIRNKIKEFLEKPYSDYRIIDICLWYLY